MREVKAYALVNKRGYLGVISEKLPIYWLKKVARIDAEKYGMKVIKGTIKLD